MNALHFLKVRVSQADNYAFGDELKALISYQYSSGEFTITVKPQSSWIPDISITGAGSSASNPIRVNVGDGVTATDPIAYTIKLPENMKKELTPFVTRELSKILNAGVTATFSKKISGGFTIGPKDGGYFLSFTDETFKELICEYLRPATRRLLFGEN